MVNSWGKWFGWHSDSGIMKRLYTYLAAALLSVGYALLGADYIPFNETNRIPFEANPAVELSTFDWAVRADINRIQVYSNGIVHPHLEDPNGVASVMLEKAWEIQPHATGITVAVFGDFSANHEHFVSSIIRRTAPGVTVLEMNTGFNKDLVAEAITNAVNQGAQVFNFSWDFNSGLPPTNVINALAHYDNVLTVVAADNFPGEMRLVRSWIVRYSTSNVLQNVICVNNMAKDGSRFFSAWGDACFIGADGRRVIAEKDGQYFSATGCSYAAPRVTGVLALLLAKGFTPQEAKARLVFGADKDWDATNSLHGTLNAWASLYQKQNEARTMSLNLSNGINRVEWSTDLTNWTDFTLKEGPGQMRLPVGVEVQRYWRAIPL